MTTATQTRKQNSPPPSDAGKAPLSPVSGVLDITGRGSAFVRVAGFHASPDDVAVPAGLIKQYDLRRGDELTGRARTGPARNGPAKNPALATVGTINGVPVPAGPLPASPVPASPGSPDIGSPAHRRPHFDQLTPVYADERLRLEAGGRPWPRPGSSTWSPRSARASAG